MHDEAHPFQGKMVRIADHVYDDRDMIPAGGWARMEDWWDHLTGSSWMVQQVAACVMYALRQGAIKAQNLYDIPIDDEVVYVKVRGIGHLLHVTELSEEVKEYDVNLEYPPKS